MFSRRGKGKNFPLALLGGCESQEGDISWSLASARKPGQGSFARQDARPLRASPPSERLIPQAED